MISPIRFHRPAAVTAALTLGAARLYSFCKTRGKLPETRAHHQDGRDRHTPFPRTRQLNQPGPPRHRPAKGGSMTSTDTAVDVAPPPTDAPLAQEVLDRAGRLLSTALARGYAGARELSDQLAAAGIELPPAVPTASAASAAPAVLPGTARCSPTGDRRNPPNQDTGPTSNPKRT